MFSEVSSNLVTFETMMLFLKKIVQKHGFDKKSWIKRYLLLNRLTFCHYFTKTSKSEKMAEKVKNPKLLTKNKAIPGLISYLETTRQRHFWNATLAIDANPVSDMAEDRASVLFYFTFDYPTSNIQVFILLLW